MNLVDVHSHLEHERFKKDLDKVIDNARSKCVKVIISSGVNPETNRAALKLSEKYDIVKASFGLYPIDALMNEVKIENPSDFTRNIEKFDVDDELGWIDKNKDKCIAIGEIGLDYNWPDFSVFKEEQKRNFEKVLKLAEKLDKPVVIHSRKAEQDAIEILEKYRLKVIMHCFSGKKSLIKRGVEKGFYFSVPPVITRLLHFKTLVEMVPLEQLLTETDAPYLSPVAGERNEPANVAVTIEEIAKIKKLSKEEVAEQIWKNANKVFKF